MDIFELLFNNGLVVQFGCVKNVNANWSGVITKPIACDLSFYFGNMSSTANGYAIRVYHVSDTQFGIGSDYFSNVSNPKTTKYWLCIGQYS